MLIPSSRKPHHIFILVPVVHFSNQSNLTGLRCTAAISNIRLNGAAHIKRGDQDTIILFSGIKIFTVYVPHFSYK